jgi:hypothetical protein
MTQSLDCSSAQTTTQQGRDVFTTDALQLPHFIERFNVTSLSIIRAEHLTQGHSEHFTFLNFSFLVGELNIQQHNVASNPQDDTNLFAIAKLYSMQR